MERDGTGSGVGWMKSDETGSDEGRGGWRGDGCWEARGARGLGSEERRAGWNGTERDGTERDGTGSGVGWMKSDETRSEEGSGMMGDGCWGGRGERERGGAW